MNIKDHPKKVKPPLTRKQVMKRFWALVGITGTLDTYAYYSYAVHNAKYGRVQWLDIAYAVLMAVSLVIYLGAIAEIQFAKDEGAVNNAEIESKKTEKDI